MQNATGTRRASGPAAVVFYLHARHLLSLLSQCVVAKKAGIGFPARGRPQCERAVAPHEPRYHANAATKAFFACPACSVPKLQHSRARFSHSCLVADCANVAMKVNAKLDGCNVRLVRRGRICSSGSSSSSSGGMLNVGADALRAGRQATCSSAALTLCRQLLPCCPSHVCLPTG